jgi:hypothetical protein
MKKDSLHSTTLLAALAMLLALLPATSFAAKPACVEGPPQAVDPRLHVRPISTAQCPYDFDDFVARITKLITEKYAVDSVETVEEAFSTPEMTTSSDDSRSSNYLMNLTGKGGWKVNIWTQESFFPTNEGPDRFNPGLRPKRLYNVRDATLIVQLDLFGTEAVSPTCLSVISLTSALKQSGWKDVTMFEHTTDGAMPSPTFKFLDKQVSIREQPTQCAQDIQLRQNPLRQ